MSDNFDLGLAGQATTTTTNDVKDIKIEIVHEWELYGQGQAAHNHNDRSNDNASSVPLVQIKTEVKLETLQCNGDGGDSNCSSPNSHCEDDPSTITNPNSAPKPSEDDGHQQQQNAANPPSYRKCFICLKQDLKRSDLARHYKTDHNITLESLGGPGPSSFKCPDCPKLLCTRPHVLIHMRLHRPKGMVLHKCDVCAQEFVHQSSRDKHKFMHSEIPQFVCSVPNCDFTSRYRSSMREHERGCFGLKRKPSASTACDTCGKRFKSQASLDGHKAFFRALPAGKCQVFICSEPWCSTKCHYARDYNDHLLKSGHQQSAIYDQILLPWAETEVWQCPDCDRNDFHSKRKLTDHIRNSHRTRWPCFRVGCGQVLSTHGEYRKHVRACKAPIRCTTCESIFMTKAEFLAHEHPLKCKEVAPPCDKSFRTKPLLDLHAAWHDPLNLNRCEPCTFAFPSVGDLTCHLKMTHLKASHTLTHFKTRRVEAEGRGALFIFQCKLCENGAMAEFKDAGLSQLAEHITQSHSATLGPHMCPACGKGFKTEQTLFQHWNNSHADVETEFKCELCNPGVGLFFLNKHGLHVHRTKSHYECPLVVNPNQFSEQQQTTSGSGEENPTATTATASAANSKLTALSCLVCGKKSPGPTALRRHLNLHRMNAQFKCELCTMSFAKTSTINRHNRLWHAELNLPEVMFRCDVCSKEFRLLKAFEIHSRRHEAGYEARQACQFCEKKFLSEATLRAHLALVHSKDRVLSCDFCEATFTATSRLMHHVRSFHGSDGLFMP